MEPVSPVLAGYEDQEKVLAEAQPQYRPLHVLVARNLDGDLSPSGLRLSRWRPTPEERLAISMGADILLYQLTFNIPLQPIRLHVVIPSMEKEIAATMGLTDARK